MAPSKGKQPAPSKKTEQKKKEKVIEVSWKQYFFTWTRLQLSVSISQRSVSL